MLLCTDNVNSVLTVCLHPASRAQGRFRPDSIRLQEKLEDLGHWGGSIHSLAMVVLKNKGFLEQERTLIPLNYILQVTTLVNLQNSFLAASWPPCWACTYKSIGM